VRTTIAARALRRIGTALIAVGMTAASASGRTAPGAAAAGQSRPADSQVAIEVEVFGVGGTVRPGALAGIRLRLTDSADAPREVAIRLLMPDPDGDTTDYTRIVTLNPRMALGTWLYARLPWDVRSGSAYTVTAHRAIAPDGGSVEIGEQIGATRIGPSRVVLEREGLMAVLGPLALGLEQYGQVYRDQGFAPAAHEITQIVGGLTPGVLPDDWKGLATFDVILWTSAGGEPAQLASDLVVQALREWVHRGGHLVVVLPPVGHAWTSSTNPLGDLMPAARIERVTGVSLEPYRPILTTETRSERPLPRDESMHRFVIAPGTPVSEATPLIEGPDGVVAIRRTVGTGAVTLIGLDLYSRGLNAGRAVRADALWHRVLGRRGDVLSPAELEKAGSEAGIIRRRFVSVDGRIPDWISETRSAGVGALLGVIVFALYWLLAGPLGFGLLKARGLERHAWMVFVAVGAVFTFVAWGGAASMRPKNAKVWHYSTFTAVHGQPVVSVRSFASVLLPAYGLRTVSIDAGEADRPWRHALTPWSDPNSAARLSFPDAQHYPADVRALTSLRVPARATIKQFQVDWLGRTPWALLRPTGEAARPEVGPDGSLKGELTHELPVPLTDVRVILVAGPARVLDPEEAVRMRGTPPIPCVAYAWDRKTPWPANEPMSLDQYVPSQDSRLEGALSRLAIRLSLATALVDTPPETTPPETDQRVALFPLIDPPDWVKGSGQEGMPTLERRIAHELDVARWFTQPCLIVMGAMENGPFPALLSVEGETLGSTSAGDRSRVVVRWIYPLPAAPLRLGEASRRAGGLAPGTP